ncbi:lens fiber major intrinsic protein-like [Argiope bruennichi]|uniref:Aquaporin-4 like protein n=1 Tax=Argiope bruennichi TaxID=94029 RepID=A0A8T0ED83_ARGBR|nr:lens fiber major intrinsic protein-like [Argiope bruennichi]KAF8768105.1 Aquaporin-4 like protein [Argiope bruennichi]
MASSTDLYSIPETGKLTNPNNVYSPVETMRRYMESLPQDLTLKEELTDQHFWKAVRTEFLATLLLTVLGCGSCLRWKAPPSDQMTASAVELRVALAFGLGVATLVQCVGQVSGGHMNPAVTVALLVTRHISLARSAAYVLAQCLGGLAGAGILYGLTPQGQRLSAGLGATEPADGVAASEAFGIEFMASVVVVITVLSNMDPQRTEMGCKSLSIGFSYVVGHLLAFPYTGASFNPARSFGPAIVTNTWRLHWIYWVAPVLGGIIGGVTYDYTQESHSHQSLRRSFRKKPARDLSALSNNETELSLDHCRL